MYPRGGPGPRHKIQASPCQASGNRFLCARRHYFGPGNVGTTSRIRKGTFGISVKPQGWLLIVLPVGARTNGPLGAREPVQAFHGKSARRSATTDCTLGKQLHKGRSLNRSLATRAVFGNGLQQDDIPCLTLTCTTRPIHKRQHPTTGLQSIR
jgi:hypothetical protein